MKIKEVIDALEKFAPLPLQEGYDNAGLQVGLTDAQVSGALLCLDVTEPIIDEAVRKGCNLIVSHHPLIFHKLRRVAGEDYVQRTVMKAIRQDVAIAAMHTNLDSARNGVNFLIAEKLGLTENISFLGQRQTVEGVEGGEGLIGEFAVPMAADDFILKLKKVFGVACVQANQLLRRPIKRVGLCGGAGAFMLKDAIGAQADAFLTGEMSYHDFFGHEQEIQIAVIGHYQSEQYTPEILRRVITRQCAGVPCYIAETDTNPIIYL